MLVIFEERIRKYTVAHYVQIVIQVLLWIVYDINTIDYDTVNAVLLKNKQILIA